MRFPRQHLSKLRKPKLPPKFKEQWVDPGKEKLFAFGKLFALIVLLPSAASIIYFGFWASDVYISESKFLVRSPQQQQPQSGIGGILSSIGVSNSGPDGYVVANYIKSLDAMMAVNKKVDLKQLFTSGNVDVFSRFASFNFNESYERLLMYFEKRVDYNYDPVSSVATLKVRAYSGQSARDINLALLENSEALVNKISDDTRKDVIDFASYQVAVSQKKLEEADAALSKYRNANNADDKNFVAHFQQLNIERDTAEKELASAIDAVQKARIDGQRKRLYIERIVQPTLPDYPLEPKRILTILSTILGSLLIWGIVRMLLASAREHSD